MEANTYTSRISYVSLFNVDRIWDVTPGTFATAEEAYADALRIVASHPFANRIHIVQGILDTYNGVVYGEMVEEHDVDRATLEAPAETEAVEPSEAGTSAETEATEPVSLTVPQLARWAEMRGALDAMGLRFAEWYARTGRTDAYVDAYDAWLVSLGSRPVAELDAELAKLEAETAAIKRMSAREVADYLRRSPA